MVNRFPIRYINLKINFITFFNSYVFSARFNLFRLKTELAIRRHTEDGPEEWRSISL